MFIIKLKVKGFLRNLTENQEEIINTKAIKNNNIISYIVNDTKYKLILENNQVILQRENEEISHEMRFIKNKQKVSEYYLKKSNYSLEFNIETINIILKDNLIDITYKIIESENVYNYVLEMSGNL